MCLASTRPDFIPAPNTARVRMVYLLDGQTVMNVFYFLASAPMVYSDLTNLASEVLSAWQAQLKPQQPEELTLSYIEATSLDAADAFQYVLPVNEAGTNGTSAVLPNNVTLSISFKTGVTGRSNRGRMYWLQLAEGQVVKSTVSPIFLATLMTKIEDFFDAIETGTSTFHSIVSYCNDGTWRTTASVLPVESYVTVDTNIDSQRRRLPGRGR